MIKKNVLVQNYFLSVIMAEAPGIIILPSQGTAELRAILGYCFTDREVSTGGPLALYYRDSAHAHSKVCGIHGNVALLKKKPPSKHGFDTMLRRSCGRIIFAKVTIFKLFS